eukprot:697066-Hanusia_phi.AAC.2
MLGCQHIPRGGFKLYEDAWKKRTRCVQCISSLEHLPELKFPCSTCGWAPTPKKEKSPWGNQGSLLGECFRQVNGSLWLFDITDHQRYLKSDPYILGEDWPR